MRSGTLDRELLWETPAGTQVLISSRRLISFVHRHVAAISYQVMLLNAAAPVVIASEMVANQPHANAPRMTRGRRGRLQGGCSIPAPAMPRSVVSCCAMRPPRAR